MSDKQIKLLPCPFCGEVPQASVDDPGAPYAGGYFTIECLNHKCPVEVRVSVKRRTDGHPGMTLEEAEAQVWPEIYEMWNQRAAPPVERCPSCGRVKAEMTKRCGWF